MKTYPSYEVLAIDLDLHFFDKVSVLLHAGNQTGNGSWVVVTDDGQCHLFDKDGNLDDINKLHILKENYVRKDVKKIIIPDSVTRIGNGAFYRCSELTNMTIPNSVTIIGCVAFSSCSNLKSVTIPNSVTIIGWYAFEYCSGLTSVTIPDSVRNIGGGAFYSCENLKNLFFKGKTLKQVKAMKCYPWGIENENVIKVEFE